MTSFKVKIPKFLAFAAGLMTLSFGMNLLIVADLGMTVHSVMPFVLNLAFPALSLGTWSYLINFLYFAAIVIIMRKMTVKYLSSFGVAMLFGYALDFWRWLMYELVIDAFPLRILVFIAGSLTAAFGVAFFMISDYPLVPLDYFAKVVVNRYGFRFGVVKTTVDSSMCALSFLASLLLLHTVEGIGAGTILLAVFLGSVINKATQIFRRIFECVDSGPDRFILRLLTKTLVG